VLKLEYSTRLYSCIRIILGSGGQVTLIKERFYFTSVTRKRNLLIC
jgi:hypothetical protein